jgi:myo-inositol 2-dehydrogenase/D-chiro-inositol 1-dehydrogenase
VSTAGPVVRTAVLGLGRIGIDHLGTLSRLPGVDVVAVSDLDTGRMSAAKASLGGAVSVYERWETMLEDTQIDALFVCTPPRHHADPAVAAMAKGIHVYLEKPLARSLEDAHAIVDAARSGAVCAVGYQWRAIDFLDELRDELADQAIGLLASQSLAAAYPRSWFLDWEEGGGILFELASHDIDLQLALAGELTEVQAIATDVQLSTDAPVGFKSVALLTLRFATGAIGSVAVACCSRTLLPLWELDLIGSDGSYYVTLDPSFEVRGKSKGYHFERKAKSDPKVRSISRFIEAVRESDPAQVFCDPTEGARSLVAVLACERALATGAAVSLAGIAQA